MSCVLGIRETPATILPLIVAKQFDCYSSSNPDENGYSVVEGFCLLQGTSTFHE